MERLPTQPTKPVEVVQFDPEIVEGLRKIDARAASEKANALNELAFDIVDRGGYRDELTFSTVFYGGIDPKMNWSHEYENECLAGNIPPEFKRGQKLAKLAMFASFEPFIASYSDYDRTRNIGLVMPPPKEHKGTTVGYKIDIVEGRRNRSFVTFRGDILFKGFSSVRSYRPYGDFSMFEVRRKDSRLDAESKVHKTEFGMIAALQHVSPHDIPRQTDVEELNAHLTDLRARADEHLKKMEQTDE